MYVLYFCMNVLMYAVVARSSSCVPPFLLGAWLGSIVISGLLRAATGHVRSPDLPAGCTRVQGLQIRAVWKSGRGHAVSYSQGKGELHCVGWTRRQRDQPNLARALATMQSYYVKITIVLIYEWWSPLYYVTSVGFYPPFSICFYFTYLRSRHL